MNKEILINALIQKADEMNDDYLKNESLTRMLVNKESKFENYEEIKDFLEFLKQAKHNAQKSK
ncbi:hypothetical protein AVANS14531_08220 [Campylobacter sp. Cr9]|uniref:hypothetical protein n=1 Tax=Campylobacter sp. Cr9 TaxID=2735728 RepID=UPI0030155E14|nr:hypothetical protein [Campylobacter sp. Cr9]